ncbi:cytochrome P450 [Tuber borchii]|uniref:Cytochrome P450 n=1 Tax=Tuber borchii TaxID=42251 RepID=A0A2T6ZP22_TUBBO|nr:cytochrome P450 [Tuber borchii]
MITFLNLIKLLATSFAVHISSLVLYRLFFHPLARIPGPFLAKITDWYTVYYAYRGDRHLALYRAHEKYGPVIRFAPNLISFNSASSLKTIYGHTPLSRSLQKSQFYSAFPAVKGVHNTHNAISKAEHGRKRRVLSAAFSDTALKSVEDLVLNNINVFSGKVNDAVKRGVGVDMGDLFSWLTFDVMGELCFGKSFGMLTEETTRFVTDLISQAAHNHYINGNYLPLVTLKLSKVLFPTISRDRWRFIQHSRACANERMSLGRGYKKDFFYYLLDAKDPETGEGFETKELWGEANVLMIAGSDTTATAMSAAMFYLCRNPQTLETLKNEIRSTFANKEQIVVGKELSDCRYLKACIDEAMRLAPPVPGLLPREVTAKEGIEIDGVYIPEGTVAGTPIYALHHNPAYFPDPFSFKPERWLSTCTPEEEVEAAQSAFTPFSIGPRGCIGKSVAYMELRLTLARLLFEYDCEEVETEGKAALWTEGYAMVDGEYRLMDHFTSRKEGPVMKFSKR